MRVKKFELYFKNVIYGRKRGLIPFVIKSLLHPLSWFYGIGVRCKNWLYDQGWMRHYVPPVPLVISVGNIVAGGTGKTPVTLMLAEAFYDRFSLAILSRGYRSQVEKLDLPVMLCEGNGPVFSASYCGDEPLVFAKRLPKSIVIVGGDRKKASFLAAKAGAQVILLDDGMQHRKLARDFDVVVIDAIDPFGQGHFLPRGLLRDDARSLARADLVILNHAEDSEHYERVKEQLKAYTDAPMMAIKGYVEAYRDLKGEEVAIPKGAAVAMFCAIAQPDYFRRTLEQGGFEVVAEYILPDHDDIREKKLDQFAQSSQQKGAKWLICTEKDRVKLQEPLSLPLPIAWVQMDLQITGGTDVWKNFLDKAVSTIS